MRRPAEPAPPARSGGGRNSRAAPTGGQSPPRSWREHRRCARCPRKAAGDGDTSNGISNPSPPPALPKSQPARDTARRLPDRASSGSRRETRSPRPQRPGAGSGAGSGPSSPPPKPRGSRGSRAPSPGGLEADWRSGPSVLLVGDAVLGCFPQPKLLEPIELPLQSWPHPGNDILRGGILHEVIEIVMVALGEDRLPDLDPNLLEVANHSVFGVGGPLDYHLEPVIVSVQPRAGAVVERQQVGGAEIKIHRELHWHLRLSS